MPESELKMDMFTLLRRESTFNILLCLTPDDFSCQCGESRREMVNISVQHDFRAERYSAF